MTGKHRRSRTPLWWLWFRDFVAPSDPIVRGALYRDPRVVELVERDR